MSIYNEERTTKKGKKTGVPGIEPGPRVPQNHMLPLHHVPIVSLGYL